MAMVPAAVPNTPIATPEQGTIPRAHITDQGPQNIAGTQFEQLGTGLQTAGTQLGRLQTDAIQQANQVRVNDAMNQAVAAKLHYTFDPQEGYINLRGEAALKRPDGQSLGQEYGAKLQTDISNISDGLGNDAQRAMFNQQAQGLSLQFQGAISQHVAGAYQEHQASVNKGTVELAQQQMGTAGGDVKLIDQSTAAIRAATYTDGQQHGLSAAEIEANTITNLTPGHVAVIMGAADAGQLGFANEYFKQHGDEMSNGARLQMAQKLDATTNVQAAMAGADRITADIPLATGSLDKMEQAARDMFPTDPLKAKATVEELHQRFSAFKVSQDARDATATGAVMNTISQPGFTVSKMEASSPFLALSPEQQGKMREHAIAWQWSQQQHNLEMQGKAQADLARTNFSTYLDYINNPDKLAAMSPDQIQNLLPVVGNQLTANLAERRNALQSSANKLNAKVDTDDFNHYAKLMTGIDPTMVASKSDDKASLGALHYRIEQLIQQAQGAKKAPLSRDEKGAIMQGEMARTVTVNPGFFSSNKQVPVVALSLNSKNPDNVVIPDADKAQISSALQTMWKQQPNNPDYAPTPANMLKLYLRNKSAAAPMVPTDAGQ